MAIDGRINVDVLFHDTDGTASLKVVSLEDSIAYTTGKVAIVTGTVGTASITIAIPPTAYKDASGIASTMTLPSRVAFSATGSNRVQLTDADALSLFSKDGSVSVSDKAATTDNLSVQVTGTSGTASYTLVLYGT